MVTGSAELFCQVPDQDPAVPIQDLKDVSASLFVQHRFTPKDFVRFSGIDDPVSYGRAIEAWGALRVGSIRQITTNRS
jgi:hypothetical protein